MKEKLEILEWLPSHDFQTKLKGLVEQRTPGTGKWLLEDSNFQQWKDGYSKSPLLWCKGAGTYSYEIDLLNPFKPGQAKRC